VQAAALDGVELEADDILLNITGDSVARCCRLDPGVLPGRVNQHVAIVRPDPSRLDSRYLSYWFVSSSTQAHLLSLAGAGATRNALTKAMIEELEVPVPGLTEQRAIAAVLGALDDKIELNRNMTRTLAETVQAVFKSWFVDFDEAGAVDPLTALPLGWERVPLGSVVENHDARREPLSAREREQRPGTFPYYGAAGQIDSVDGFIFDGVFVLVGEDGSVIDANNRPVVQYVWGKFWVNNHAHVLRGRGRVSDELLHSFLGRVNIRPYVTGAVQPKLSQGNLNQVPFVLPDADSCYRFDALVKPLYARLRVCSEEAATLGQVRDGPLPRLLSGELRIPAAEKAVEEVV
jgi:restriction endonuclease S subunit